MRVCERSREQRRTRTGILAVNAPRLDSSKAASAARAKVKRALPAADREAAAWPVGHMVVDKEPVGL